MNTGPIIVFLASCPNFTIHCLFSSYRINCFDIQAHGNTLALLLEEDSLFTVSESLNDLQLMAKQVERDWIACPLANFSDLEIGMSFFPVWLDNNFKKLFSSVSKTFHKVNLDNIEDVPFFEYHAGWSRPLSFCFYSSNSSTS